MDDQPSGAISPGSRHRQQGPRKPNLRLIAWIAVGVAVTLLVAAGVIMTTRKGPPPTAAPGPGTSGAPAPAAAPPPPPSAPPPSGAPGPGTTGAAPPPPAGLDDFPQLAATLNAVVGIALSPVGRDQQPISLGEPLTDTKAWSTMKVPLVIAALNDKKADTATSEMTAAITESNNQAAESIWKDLNDDPVKAAGMVQDVLRKNGDQTTIVESQRRRPQYTAFGQTDWSLTNQVRFTAAAFCDKTDEPVFRLMGQIAGDQSWGIGHIPDARFKGGWGPSPTGNYLVRQIGVLNAPNGLVAVALAAQPNSGKFDDGITALNQMANWLTTHLAALPAGHCGS